MKTGTTTVSIVGKDAVIMAADRKATMGYLVASKDVEKIAKLQNHIGMTIAGVVGDAQTLVKYLTAEYNIYRLQEGRKIPLRSAAALAANILYSRRFYPYFVQLIIAGHDDEGPSLYTLSPDGSVIPEKYFSTGSGSPMAFGLLEQGFREGMGTEEAAKLAANSVKVAVRRDIASGGSGIDVVIIDSKGYKKLDDAKVKSMLN